MQGYVRDEKVAQDVFQVVSVVETVRIMATLLKKRTWPGCDAPRSSVPGEAAHSTCAKQDDAASIRHMLIIQRYKL